MASSTDNNDIASNKTQINSLYETLKAFSTRGSCKRTRVETKEDALRRFVALTERGLVSTSSIVPRWEQAVVVVTKSNKKSRNDDSKNEDNLDRGHNHEKTTTTARPTDELTAEAPFSNIVNSDNPPADSGDSAEEMPPSNEDVDGKGTEDGNTDNENKDVEKKRKDDFEIMTVNFVERDEIRYKKMEEEQTKVLEGIEKARQRVFSDQSDLWGVYKYGLQHVLNLNDLSDAPDAILPGNFCTNG